MVSGNRQHAEALREEVAAVIAPLGLALADDKTRVVHIDEGVDFLGIRIRRQQKRGTSKYYVYTTPSRKALASIRAKVKAMTYRATRNGDLADLLTQMNRVLSGWARYFRYGPVRRVFAQIDYFAWGRLMKVDTRQVPRRNEGTPPAGSAFRDHGESLPGRSRSRAHPASHRAVTATAATPSRPPGPSSQQPSEADQRVRHAESPVRGDALAGFGERAGETDWPQDQHRAPARLNGCACSAVRTAWGRRGTGR